MQRRKMHTPDDVYMDKLAQKLQTVTGAEIPDPTPMEPPLGYKRMPTMVDHIREMVRSERLRQEAEAAGKESFEEADDFSIEDEVDIMSGYEFEDVFEPAPEQSRYVSREELAEMFEKFIGTSGGEREPAATSGGAATDRRPEAAERVKDGEAAGKAGRAKRDP